MRSLRPVGMRTAPVPPLCKKRQRFCTPDAMKALEDRGERQDARSLSRAPAPDRFKHAMNHGGVTGRKARTDLTRVQRARAGPVIAVQCARCAAREHWQ